MSRLLAWSLPVVVILVAAGCAWRSDSAAAPAPEPVAATVPVVCGEPAGPSADITERSRAYKDSLDDGRDVLAELSAPIEPVFTTRTYGELVQVTFTRIGGDDDVDVSSSGDMVVFSSNRHSEDHNIYTKSVAGAVVTQKTFKSFDEIQPRFSPDGKRIAYASNKNGNYDIWIVDAGTTGPEVQVTFGDEDDLHPSWTPGGECVVYSSFSSRTGDWSIMEANLKSGEVRDLGPGKFPEVSPDGSKILFQRARQRDGYWYSIWTMGLDGTEQTEIIASADWAAINPCWSPDGQFIAFATVNKSPQSKIEDRIWQGDDIYVIGVNGRGLIQVTADSQPDWQPRWSQRDGRIYFVSERNGFRNIWSVRPPVFPETAEPAAPAAPSAPAAPAEPAAPPASVDAAVTSASVDAAPAAAVTAGAQ